MRSMATLARQVRRAEDEVVQLPALLVVRDVEDVVQALARPLGVPQAGGGHEQHPAPLPLRLAQKLEALVVRGEAEERHAASTSDALPTAPTR